MILLLLHLIFFRAFSEYFFLYPSLSVDKSNNKVSGMVIGTTGKIRDFIV